MSQARNRQRGDGRCPLGKSKSPKVSIRKKPIPPIQCPMMPINAPAGSELGCIKRAEIVYSCRRLPDAHSNVPVQKIQPIGFSGRREAMSEPTVANANRTRALKRALSHSEGEFGICKSREMMTMTRESTHVNHANPKAVRL